MKKLPSRLERKSYKTDYDFLIKLAEILYVANSHAVQHSVSFSAMDRDLRGMCAVSALTMSHILTLNNLKHSIFLLECDFGQHTIVKCGEYYIDSTASQFGCGEVKYYVTRSFKEVKKNCYYDFHLKKKNEEAVKEITSNAWCGQAAKKKRVDIVLEQIYIVCNEEA